MPKTVSIPDDIHDLVTKKQKEIFNKYRVSIRIADLIAILIENSIDRTEEYLFKSDTLVKKDDIIKQPEQQAIIQHTS